MTFIYFNKGVTAWECLSLASQPYDKIDPFELADWLSESESNRLEKPASCSAELYDIIAACWRVDASKRPSLKELFHTMHNLYMSLNNYV